MERFLKRHKDRHLGSIAGFDRLLFRGVLRSICYVEGLNYFMGNQRVPFKGFAAFVEKFSAGVKACAERIAERAGRPFLYVPSGQASKEARVAQSCFLTLRVVGLLHVAAAPAGGFRPLFLRYLQSATHQEPVG